MWSNFSLELFMVDQEFFYFCVLSSTSNYFCNAWCIHSMTKCFETWWNGTFLCHCVSLSVTLWISIFKWVTAHWLKQDKPNVLTHDNMQWINFMSSWLHVWHVCFVVSKIISLCSHKVEHCPFDVFLYEFMCESLKL